MIDPQLSEWVSQLLRWAHVIAAIAWIGSSFYFIHLDLSLENLAAGTRLAVGEAVVEVTADPHTGCAKFSARFGSDALRFVNSPDGRELRLRGLNARVVQAGTVRAGDTVRKL